MRWMETVSMLSDRVKKQMIQEHGQSGEDLSFLLDPHYLDQCWTRLAEDDKQVIRFFLWAKGEDFLTYRELEQGNLPLPSARFRLALTRLRRLGFVYTLRRLWGELAYVIPRELLALFRRQLVPEHSSWKRDRILPVESSYHILQDILQALNNVRYHPLELTKKGTVNKKSLRQMFAGLAVSKEMFAFAGNSTPCLPPYDKHEAILLDLLSQWDLWQIEEDRLGLKQVENWVQESQQNLQRQFCELLYPYLNLSPSLQFCWDLCMSLRRNQVYSLGAILESMGDFAPSMESVLTNWLEPLARMGIIRSLPVEGDTLWMWVEWEEWPSATIYVQPNFEILLPAFSPMKRKWEILSFASLQKKEEMWSLSLTRQSVQPYLESGGTAQELLAYLEQHSSVPLTDQMKETIQQWEREFQQISFMDCRIMQVSHRDLADEMVKIPSIARFLRGRLGDRAFLVHVTAFEQLRDELELRGYPIGPVQNLLLPQEEKKTRELQVFKPSAMTVDYKVESVFPDLEDAIPGLRQLPKMWMANYSRYHESTLRDLLQKAAQLNMEVRLQWKGKESRIYPLSVVNKNGYWHVQGYGEDRKEQDVRLEDIGNIQILWP
ncbi:helicase-associated domain-containing protein [Ammoniphilus sp. 3BR4]|uniref:helicase-associated domain-containing protein n=1 Tax=Ammoniphilus sp. 3BR4 TaxID=3158265 RepID=UPI003466E6B8